MEVSEVWKKNILKEIWYLEVPENQGMKLIPPTYALLLMLWTYCAGALLSGTVGMQHCSVPKMCYEPMIKPHLKHSAAPFVSLARANAST